MAELAELKRFYAEQPESFYEDSKGVLFHGDCLQRLKNLAENSIDLVLTDPPYFIDGLGDDWDNSKLQTRIKKAGVVGGRPVGMKFERAQSYNFQEFMRPVAEECYRILKPGGFFISFSQARLYHRLACSIEDGGFEIRDMLAWHHNGQAKAFSQDHFINKRTDISDTEKKAILRKLRGRKTPQLKPQMEPMVLGQKPKQGTFIDNWLQYETGLIDTEQSLDGGFPGNLMAVPRPGREERGENNFHFTVKPVALLSHIIRIFTIEEQVVLDPFMGSGSTAVAAIQSSRRYCGIEREAHYFDIAKQRIKQASIRPHRQENARVKKLLQ